MRYPCAHDTAANDVELQRFGTRQYRLSVNDALASVRPCQWHRRFRTCLKRPSSRRLHRRAAECHACQHKISLYMRVLRDRREESKLHEAPTWGNACAQPSLLGTTLENHNVGAVFHQTGVDGHWAEAERAWKRDEGRARGRSGPEFYTHFARRIVLYPTIG